MLSVQATIDSIKKTFNQQQQIRQGIRIAIIGSVNAGKSSLFNALLNQDRAIVNAIAGTTRDSIEADFLKTAIIGHLLIQPDFVKLMILLSKRASVDHLKKHIKRILFYSPAIARAT